MYNNKTMHSHGRDVYDFGYWQALVRTARRGNSKPIANNTRAEFRNGGDAVAIKLHDTDIVTITKDNHYILNSGGWRTVTTKERINRYTPGGISQRKGVWYMRDGSLFYDGIELKSDGTPYSPRKPAAYEQRLAKIKKDARQYARDFVAALEAGTVGLPSAGDCWGCVFATKAHPQPMGAGHIKQHIADRYYVPSLLVNAGRDAGYRDEQIGLMGIGGHRLFIDPENNIYKYVVKELQKEF